MKKFSVVAGMLIASLTLSACAGYEFDTESFEGMTDTINSVSEVAQSMTAEAEEIQSAINDSQDSINNITQWYNEEGYKTFEEIRNTLSDDDVQEMVDVGLEEVNDYLLTEEEFRYFDKYFNLKDSKTSIMSTYESKSEYLPVNVKGRPDNMEFSCGGGFHYNDLYLLMINSVDDPEVFAITVLEKKNDNIEIMMNYYTEDMDDIEFDGSFLYDLYQLMLNSELADVIMVPGNRSDIYLGANFEMPKSISINSISKVADLVSDASDKTRTYMQSFDGYDVFYSKYDSTSVKPEDYIVSEIIIRNGEFATDAGIRIGSTLKELEEAYGDGTLIKLAGGKKQLIYEFEKYSMAFTIDKNSKVELIDLYMTGSDETEEKE